MKRSPNFPKLEELRLPLPKDVKAFVLYIRFRGNMMEEQKFYHYRNSDFFNQFELLFKITHNTLKAMTTF